MCVRVCALDGFPTLRGVPFFAVVFNACIDHGDHRYSPATSGKRRRRRFTLLCLNTPVTVCFPKRSDRGNCCFSFPSLRRRVFVCSCVCSASLSLSPSLNFLFYSSTQRELNGFYLSLPMCVHCVCTRNRRNLQCNERKTIIAKSFRCLWSCCEPEGEGRPFGVRIGGR